MTYNERRKGVALEILKYLLFALLFFSCSDPHLIAVYDNCKDIHRFRDDTTFVVVKTRFEEWVYDYEQTDKSVEQSLLFFTISGNVLSSFILEKDDSLNSSPHGSLSRDYAINSTRDNTILLQDDRKHLYIYHHDTEQLEKLSVSIDSESRASLISQDEIVYTLNDSLYRYNIRTKMVTPFGTQGRVAENRSSDTLSYFLYQTRPSFQLTEYDLSNDSMLSISVKNDLNSCYHITVSDGQVFIHHREKRPEDIDHYYDTIITTTSLVCKRDSILATISALPTGDIAPVAGGTKILGKNQRGTRDTFLVYDSDNLTTPSSLLFLE